MLLNCGVGEDSWESLVMQGDQSSQLKGNQRWIIFGKVKAEVAKSCLTICDSMDCSIHGILQARILEWAAVPFSRGSSQPRDWTQVSCIAGGLFTNWAIREAHHFFFFFVRTEAPKLLPPDVKSQLIGKDWCWTTMKAGIEGSDEDEMVGWHHQFNWHEFEKTPGDSEELQCLACYSPYDCRVEHDLVIEQ